MSPVLYVFLLGMNVALNVFGTYLFRASVAGGIIPYAVLGVGCYALAAALFVYLLEQNQQLAILGPISAILGMVSVVLIGLAFGESLEPIQWAGVIVAIASVLMISTPSFQ